MSRRPDGTMMQGQGQRGDLTLPPSFRRFNETLNQMQREMDMVMNSFFGEDLLRPFPFDRPFGMGLPALAAIPSPAELVESVVPPALVHMEFHEDDKQYTLTAEVPGFNKDHVKASLSPDGILTLKGELKEEEGDGKAKRKMQRFSSFSRSFRLPNDADLEGIHVQVKDGVAQLTVPKQDKKQRQHKEIPVK
jgi:HSP20 family protein